MRNFLVRRGWDLLFGTNGIDMLPSPSFFESKSFFVLAATVLMTLQPFLTTMTKVDGAYQYLQSSRAAENVEQRRMFLRHKRSSVSTCVREQTDARRPLTRRRRARDALSLPP